MINIVQSNLIYTLLNILALVPLTTSIALSFAEFLYKQQTY